MVWAIVYVINVLYWYYEPDTISFAEIFLASCMFMARNCVIAFKYAFFSPAATHDRLTRLWTPEENSEALILAGWRVLSQHTREKELRFAMTRG